MEIWKLYEHQNIFLKYFPALPGESEVEYNYRLLRIPGLFKTELDINETFRLSDDELIEYLHDMKYIEYEYGLTRLSSYYIVQLSLKTKDEFYRYLDRLKIGNAFFILFNIYRDKSRGLILSNDYFAKRWEKGLDSYQDILSQFKIYNVGNVRWLRTLYEKELLVYVFRKLTRENRDEEIDKLIPFVENITSEFPFKWGRAFIPYSSDKYIEYAFGRGLSITDAFKEALSAGKERLDYIINYLAMKNLSYQDQIDRYINQNDIGNDWSNGDLTEFLIVVTEIIRLGNIDYKTIPVKQGSKFEVWVDRTENQV